MNWHADRGTIEAYVDGGIDDASAFSLEAHVLACAACRRALSARTNPELHERAWSAIRLEIDRPSPGAVERSLRALGVPGHIARLLVVIPSLRASWLLAVAISVTFAALSSRAVGGDALPFLVLAPLVPLAGVATAFGKPIDPVWEIGLSAPFGGFRLMLIRAASVLATSTAIAAIGALLLVDGGWLAAAWLVPALALTLLVLAVSSTSISTTTASVIVGTCWVAGVVLVDRFASDPLTAFGSAAQVVFAVVAVASAAVLVGRHAAFDRPASI